MTVGLEIRSYGFSNRGNLIRMQCDPINILDMRQLTEYLSFSLLFQ